MTDQPIAPYISSVAIEWPDDGSRHRRVTGALLFVDISGFTAMSERLAVLGREGAERVTDIIEFAFASLLVRPYELGASLVKFGGDALLLLFRGEDATARASASALAMRARLAEIGRIETPAGPVQLAMSSGVHAGEIDLFLVGGSHRELLVTGPAATAVVDAEGGAGAGNVVVSPAAAAELPDACLGDPLGSGRVLVAAPDAGDYVVPKPNPDSPELLGFLPAALRRHLADGGRDRAEHRRAAVAFLHFDDTDALVARDPEAAADGLDELVRAVQVAADAHDVCFVSSDVDHDGGKLILAAGAPLTHEDDVDRMLLAVRQVVDAGTSVPVRIGVHAGTLLAAEVGPFYRRFYTVMGDTVNTAARVMSRAGAGEVLVTDTTLAESTVPFATESIPPFAVKGKAEPLEASRLGARAALDATVDDGTETELFGRADLLADLGRRLDASLAGAGGGVDLVGDAGAGKTALARALVAGRPGLDVVVLRCHRSIERVPFAPVEAAIRRTLGVAVDDPPERIEGLLRSALAERADRIDERISALALVLGLRTGGQEDAERDPGAFQRLVAETVDVLLDIAHPDGLLLVVENAQWIDEASADLVRRLTRLRRPRCTISTRRPGGEVALGLPEVAVEPLAEEHAIALVVEASGDRLLPAEARRVAERAGGNPQFLVQLAGLVGAGDVDLDELPATLESVFAARLDRLDPGVRASIRALSVLGVEFATEDAGMLLEGGTTAAVALVDDLPELLVAHEGRIRFRDTLLQDAAYRGLAFRRRRELHRLVGDRLEARLPTPAVRAEELAVHFGNARDHGRCLHYAVIAADRAAARLATDAAARLGSMALESGRRVGTDDRTAARMWGYVGVAAMGAGRLEDAVAPYAKARELLRDEPIAAARQCLRDGELRRAMGATTQAVRWYRQGRRLLDGAPVTDEVSSTLVRLMAGEAIVRHSQGRSAEARDLLDEALVVAEATGDDAGVAQCCLWLLQTGARPEDVERLGRRALAVYEAQDAAAPVAWVRNALGNAAQAAGDVVTAVGHYRAAADALARAERSVEAAVVSVNVGSLQMETGALASAREAFEGAARTFRTAGHPYAPYAGVLAACARDAVEGGVATAVEVRERVAELEAGPLSQVVPELWRVWLTAAAWRQDEAALADRLVHAPDGLDDDALVVAYGALVEADPERGDLALSLTAAESTSTFDAGIVHATVAELRRRLGLPDDGAAARADELFGRLGLDAAPWWRSAQLAAG